MIIKTRILLLIFILDFQIPHSPSKWINGEFESKLKVEIRRSQEVQKKKLIFRLSLFPWHLKAPFPMKMGKWGILPAGCKTVVEL